MTTGAKLFRGVLFLALLVLGMYLLLKPPQVPSSQPVATAEIGSLDGSGPYWVRQNGELHFHEVQGPLPARALQTLRTPGGTQVRVEFFGGAGALIHQNTLAILDRSESSLEILVFEGSAQILEQGKFPLAVIHSQFKNWSQEEVNLADEATLPEAAPSPTEDSPSESSPAGQDHLSDSYIHEVLGRQRRFLRSCFIKYFHRKDGQVQKGRVVLNLFIDNSGKVQSTNVISSEIEDEGYLSCLQSVVSRTRFRPFEGPPLSVEYPIDLALP